MRYVPSVVTRYLGNQLKRRGWKAPGDSDLSNHHWTMQAGLQRLKSVGISPHTVVDIGAAEGKWTLMSLRIFPDAKFLLCEPLPHRRRELSELVSKSDGKLSLAPVVVGNSTGVVQFDVSSDLDGSGVYGGTSDNVIELPQKTLDGLLTDSSFDPPYMVKFDTHGFESQILSGAIQTLGATHAIVMECYLHHVSPTAKLFWEMCGQLSELGFRPIYISDLMARTYDATLWQLDIFFIRSDHPVFSYSGYC